MGAPSVVAWGTAEQQERYLRAIATGERWCQLFSEPGAGSDLAAIGPRAVRENGGWRVTGRKVWTSMATSSQRGMLLARTDPAQPKHRGLTYFVLDLTTPGVEIRPLRQITGQAEFSEVYLTDVWIPDADRLGPVDAGWKVAMSTLMNERDMFGTKATESGPVELALALYRERDGHDPALRSRMVQVWLRGHVLRLYAARAARRASGAPGPESSVSKVGFAELNKAGYELCLDLLGDEALLYDTYEPHEPATHSSAGASRDPRRLFLRSRATSSCLCCVTRTRCYVSRCVVGRGGSRRPALACGAVAAGSPPSLGGDVPGHPGDDPALAPPPGRAVVRAGVHRARHPALALGRCDRAPDRGVGGATGPQSDHGPGGAREHAAVRDP
ncbi:hypothetical protein GCM10010191_22180 [Actinomadura vinacea]|uniref:Acyl-CoA dehydrogenase n=1 Tax=Actinomadura vinacea TaxID=115336 RepID=A0ABN3IRT1_9ACTN